MDRELPPTLGQCHFLAAFVSALPAILLGVGAGVVADDAGNPGDFVSK
jgi:hypothetical protein